jgi:hypothetical protein
MALIEEFSVSVVRARMMPVNRLRSFIRYLPSQFATAPRTEGTCEAHETAKRSNSANQPATVGNGKE